MVGFDVADESKAATAEFDAMGKNVAMQIAAMSPAYLDEASVPAEVVEHEKTILAAQMKEDPKMASKPEAVLAKIAAGKMGKYYKENCLVDQEFVRSDLFQGDVKGYVTVLSVPSNFSSLRASTSAGFVARIVFATPSTKLINFSFLATKSVSEFTSTTTPFLASAS